MQVKELIEFLSTWNPEADVLVRLGGSFYPTDNIDEHSDYNFDSPDEVFILAMEE